MMKSIKDLLALTHNKPAHKHRIRLNEVSRKSKIAMAQATSNRYRDEVKISLSKAPWDEGIVGTSDEVDE